MEGKFDSLYISRRQSGFDFLERWGVHVRMEGREGCCYVCFGYPLYYTLFVAGNGNLHSDNNMCVQFLLLLTCDPLCVQECSH